ncbi:uncharacterized protein GGS22DRAFT_162518 [Annulohypoxylon maeteangense]|uniref:uncharacterized protein n=1 Tax=Annulohypoxylon maeteangense TaxID=1927788 RepID=UPI0020073BD9|nr:uncharacterized protein GGS22DRAFT_162518 [Annulohypoxylon maeteangense]KAI0885022.1 hypothetical protein GGS22DRAFT_162518 [Annulohypoxylon maeteangense]
MNYLPKVNYTAGAKAAAEGATKAATLAAKWAAANPKSAVAYGVGGTALAIPAIIAGPALAAAGFGANGIIGASLASGAQAAVGNVAAGSLFATLQSAGMAGYGAAIVNGVVQAGGAAVLVATGGTSALMSKAGKCPRKSDLVLIEKTWDSLRSNLKEDSGDCPGTSEDGTGPTAVEDALANSWSSIPLDLINDLVASTPQQIEAFSKNDGSTGY